MAEKEEQPVVEWTETAEIQLIKVLNYWTERNKSTSYAEKLSEAVWLRTTFLAENPFTSIKTDFPNTRKAAMGHYAILYQVSRNGILVTSFWDNRQDPKKLYQFLKGTH